MADGITAFMVFNAHTRSKAAYLDSALSHPYFFSSLFARELELELLDISALVETVRHSRC